MWGVNGEIAEGHLDDMLANHYYLNEQEDYYYNHPKSPKNQIKMKKLKTVDIKGKKYVTVNERLKHFRETYTSHQLHTQVVHFAPAQVVTMNGKDAKKDAEIMVKATIKDANGITIAEGLAYEKESSSFINKTSFVENAETSAWGRALANFGIGIDENVATADEVANAISNQ